MQHLQHFSFLYHFQEKCSGDLRKPRNAVSNSAREGESTHSAARLGTRLRLVRVLRKQLLTPNDRTPNTQLARAALQVRLLRKPLPSKCSLGSWLWQPNLGSEERIHRFMAGSGVLRHQSCIGVARLSRPWLMPCMPVALFFVVDVPKEGLQRSQQALSAKVVHYISGY